MSLYNIIRDRYDYDEKTGWLIWKNCHYKNRNGMRAGSFQKSSGYRDITIDKKNYYEHRIIWLWFYGYLPENDIDHINRIRNCNWISNLREVSRSCNIKNIGLSYLNKTGIVGVPGRNNKYEPNIRDNKGKKIYLGTFDTLLEATKARYIGEIKYNYKNCNSTSTALKFIKDNDPEWLNGEMQVERKEKNKQSGVKWVSFNKLSNKWQSRIKINIKIIHLGYFIDLDDAVIARYEAEVKYNKTKNSQSYGYLVERSLI